MKLSILTATYNRAKYLPRLYESIKNSFKKNLTPCYQKNSGKMSAINEAVKYATGQLIVDCDSDDYFTEDAFEKIEKNAPKLIENQSLYAIIFLKKEESGEISGKEFIKEKETTMFDLYFKDDIQGEKIVVFNSEIRKKFTHELVKDEKFITEARMYHKMDEKYKVIVVNEAIEQGSYIDDGYTKNINKTFKKYPYGYYMYFKEILQKEMKGILWNKRLYIIKHYILFGYLTKNKFDDNLIKDRLNKFLYRVLYLPGILKSRKF